MFSKALFKQSCKANGLMWMIITLAVCFMLSCVMLISGKSDIGEVKDSIKTTIIEATIESNMKKESISTYEISINGVNYFDEAFVSEFYTSASNSNNQAIYGETYTTLIAGGEDSTTAKTTAFQNAFVKPAYEAAVAERLSSRIMDGLFEGTVSGDTEKAEFYTELSENNTVLIQIRNTIIRRIKDLFLAS